MLTIDAMNNNKKKSVIVEQTLQQDADCRFYAKYIEQAESCGRSYGAE